MPLPAGTRFGAYEIIGLLGRGGMGEVYRARDLTLRRDVAIKILTGDVAVDPDSRSRFDREAHALAALNHPHIGAIYGVEESSGERALVLELVEGETLADRLARGPLSIALAQRLAAEVASALDAAHSAGIIHRDLKPANITLTRQDAVKVLDFGLARIGPVTPDPNASTDLVTRAGVVMGTVAYMSPEQARGGAVDKRTDIWAFGCVLYEMLTGARAFPGESTLEILTAIGTQDPDLATLPAATPLTLRRLIERCLLKDPQRRLRDLGDAHLDDVADAIAARASDMPARRPAWGWLGAVALTGLLSAWLSWSIGRTPPPVPTPIAFSIDPPDGVAWGELPPDPFPSVSPDGQRIGFAGRSAEGTALWIRELGDTHARKVPATEDVPANGNTNPRRGIGALSWAADSRRLAYCTPAGVKIVDLTGRPPVVVPAECLGLGGWNANGDILLSRRDGVFQMRESGGAATRVTTLSAARETAHAYPQWLPDGRHILFVVRAPAPDVAGLYVAAVSGGGPPTRVLADDSRPTLIAAPDGALYVLFVRRTTLLAQRLDSRTFATSGEPTVVAEPIVMGVGRIPSVAVSPSLLVYRTNAAFRPAEWKVVNRRGDRLQPSFGGEAGLGDGGLSRDEKSLAYSRFNTETGQLGLWIADIASRTERRLVDAAYFAALPAFSPDGRRVAFSAASGARLEIVDVVAGTVSTLATATPASGLLQGPEWSPDGRTILVSGTSDIIAIRAADGAVEPAAIARQALQPCFSPDGRWIAFSSSLSGTPEVWVQSFPSGAPVQVSRGGGFQPRWRGDGQELVYLTPEGSVMALPVATTPTFAVRGDAVRLFRDAFRPDGQTLFRRDLLISRDGQRIFVQVPMVPAPPLTAVRDWLTKLAAPKR